jgi:hypothetical protein
MRGQMPTAPTTSSALQIRFQTYDWQSRTDIYAHRGVVKYLVLLDNSDEPSEFKPSFALPAGRYLDLAVALRTCAWETRMLKPQNATVDKSCA